MPQLMTSFGKDRREILSHLPLTDDQLRRVAPSVFAAEAHPSRSDRFIHIPTSAVIEAMRGEGFEPFFAAQTRPKDAGSLEYTKHMVRLRRPVEIDAEEAHELIIVNSHNAASRWNLMGGSFRFVCANGLIHGTTESVYQIRHSGDAISQVIETAFTVIDGFERAQREVTMLKSVDLTERQQLAFAEEALALRFEEGQGRITPAEANTAARPEDVGSSAWLALNRCQEALIRGGRLIASTNHTQRRRHSRPVTAIDTSVRLNRELWALAVEHAEAA